MAFKEYLLIPGPTPVPPQVIAAMAKPMINHRGPEFTVMYNEIMDGLKWSFQSKNDVLLFPASGTGGMEAAVVNILSPGDKVVVCNIGAFGMRFVKILTAYGANVIDIKSERGKGADLAKLKATLEADKNKEIKAVFFQQNETSTGVLNPVEEITKIVQKHGALTVVDAVSGLLTADLKQDAWGVDVVVAGSQKAYMVPPGLAVISANARAWKANESAKMPRFYWDWLSVKKWIEKGQTPTTPALSVLYGLQESLKMLKAETLEGVFKRHELLAKAVRKAVKALGFKLLADDAVASMAVTAIVPPEGVDAEVIRKEMRVKYGVVLAGGQEELKGKIFRLGHLGYIDKLEILGTFAALEMQISSMGHKVEFGKSVAALQEGLLQ